MKPRLSPLKSGAAGIMLIECVVYIALMFVIGSLGLAAYYNCWEQSQALHRNADDISRALQAGERWRADIRQATGKITVEYGSNSQFLSIPIGVTKNIQYRFNENQVQRKASSENRWTSVLSAVKTSNMKAASRNYIVAWSWELELMSKSKSHLRPLFIFEAASPILP